MVSSGGGGGGAAWCRRRVGVVLQLAVRARLPELLHRDLSQLLWVGAVPGDIPEIVVYCHIFGAAKQLHTAVMSAICDPETGEFPVRYDVQANLPILEDKVGAVL